MFSTSLSMTPVTSYRLAAVISLLLVCSSGVQASWFTDNFIDPEDGMLDASDYLASAHGFFPVPIIITEPAVGFGLGAAVAYFHPEREKRDSDAHPHVGPPSISAVFGAKTENGTQLYGGAHLGIWKDDHVRYTGAVAQADVNLKFFGFDSSDVNLASDGLNFNVEGLFLLQGLEFRLRESNWWLGVRYVYQDSDVKILNFEDLPPEIPDPQFGVNDGSLKISIEYDARNSFFTATSGLMAKLEIANHGKTWGGDFDYDVYSGEVQHFSKIGKQSSLGLRLVGDVLQGTAPFYAYPFVALRGIPIMRYQGDTVLVGEAEFLWGLTPRWSIVFFGGAGTTSDVNRFSDGSETVVAGGLGFRYNLARKMGLQSGVDVARGPEDTAIYLTIGSAWY
jgi:hypothetical protein